MIRRLGWVTASGARGLDEDEPSALEALTRLGVQVDVLDWDDSTVNWASYDRVVLRSAWDYAERLDEFLGWVEAVDAVTDLRNPRPMLGWSVDKHCLLDLAAAGVAIVSTTVLEAGQEPAVPAEEIVVKPAVGAGSRDVASYAPSDLHLVRAHVRRLHDRAVRRTDLRPRRPRARRRRASARARARARRALALPGAGGRVRTRTSRARPDLLTPPSGSSSGRRAQNDGAPRSTRGSACYVRTTVGQWNTLAL